MQFVLYGPQPVIMDAISATIVADMQAQFHNRIEVATNKLITRLLYHIILNPSTAASACHRPWQSNYRLRAQFAKLPIAGVQR
jgi:hypothetical protein